MPFDREKYRHHLEPLGLSKESEDEVLDFMNLLCSEIIAIAHGEHPVQQTGYMTEERDANGTVVPLPIDAISTFNRASVNQSEENDA